jgi:hypothetical protein
MKESTRESEKSKAAAERVARKERRRRREERRATAESDAHPKKGPTLLQPAKPKAASPNGGSHQPPADVPVDLQEPQERKRMKTVITQDNFLQMLMSDDPADAKIALCDEHYDKLVEKINRHGIAGYVSKNEDELKAKIKARKIDPLFHATDALIRVALNTIGSEGVVQHRCPVCALNKFDFIAQIAQYMRQACRGT